MGLHIYCIVPAGHPVPDDCAGLEDCPPAAVDAGALAVWVTEHASAVAPSLEAVRTHNDVVRAAMTPRVTPVPMRFGQWLATREKAADRVAADADRWTSLLLRFAGRAEYGVRVLRTDPDAERDVHRTGAESGKEYMAALARRQARANRRREDGERIAAAIADSVGDLAVDQRVEYGTAGDLLIQIAHLVAWSAAEAYHGAVHEVYASREDTRFALTGPWPPYSFVE